MGHGEAGIAEMRWLPKENRSRTVRLGEQRVKIIGSIGATETILNVTDVKCSAGDTAAFELDPLYARGFQIEYR